MNHRGWRALGAAVRGSYHEKTDQPCQDSLHWEQTADGVFLAALADGAGSAALGEVGAAKAACAALESIRPRALAETLDRPDASPQPQAWMIEAFRAARAAVEAEAATRRVVPRELASTLILVAAAARCVAVAQVGDGAVVFADGDGELTALTAPATGEYLNETRWLVSPGALDDVQYAVRRCTVTHLAAFSDGLQMLALKMPAAIPHPRFFTPLFALLDTMVDEGEAADQLQAFLRSPTIRQRTDDDLSLLLACLPQANRPGTAALPSDPRRRAARIGGESASSAG